MRLARFNGGRLGVIMDDGLVDISDLSPLPPTIRPQVNDLALFAEFDARRSSIEAATGHRARTPLHTVTLESPVGRPANLLAFPVNYHAHQQEMASPNRADRNGFFLKATTSLSGPGAPIVLPDLPGYEIHHECELAVIIGSGGRHLSRSRALEHVLGYACLIDVTVRGPQERVMRKSFDTFTPLGPWIVTADEIGDPGELELALSVNGEVRQRASTRELIVDVAGLIELASSVMTLSPGDVLATGTPAGVRTLHGGDQVEITITGIGSMTVPVVTGQGGSNMTFSLADGPVP